MRKYFLMARIVAAVAPVVAVDSQALRNRYPQWLIVLLASMSLSARAVAQADPLPSWNDGAAKKAITAFVQATTTPGPKFVAPEARVATFDQDGTLWVEQPIYTQLMYSLDKVPAVVAKKTRTRDSGAIQDGALWRPRGHREVIDAGSRKDSRRDTQRLDGGSVQ
jgi:hypothetical protein